MDSYFRITLSKDYASFSSASNLDFSSVEGLIAYTGRYDSANDNVVLTKAGKVKGATGLVLSGTKGATYNVPILDADAETDEIGENDLVACVDGSYVGTENTYFLSNGKFVKANNAGSINPGKSYLSVADRANSASSPMQIVFGDTPTGVSGVSASVEAGDGAYYNLNGMKVERPQHGVYIRNGKKVVLK